MFKREIFLGLTEDYLINWFDLFIQVEALLKKVSQMEGAINADVLNKEITELKTNFDI